MCSLLLFDFALGFFLECTDTHPKIGMYLEEVYPHPKQSQARKASVEKCTGGAAAIRGQIETIKNGIAQPDNNNAKSRPPPQSHHEGEWWLLEGATAAPL